MDTKKINQIMSTIKSVAKKSTKVFGAALPVASLGATAVLAYQQRSGDLTKAVPLFIEMFTGVDQVTGKFSTTRFMQGSGSLIAAGVAGWIINQIA